MIGLARAALPEFLACLGSALVTALAGAAIRKLRAVRDGTKRQPRR